MSNLEPMGKNPCVTTLFDFPIFPCLIQLPPLKVLLLVGAFMDGEWSVAGLLVLSHTHTLHQQFDPHVGKETTTAITPCGLSTLSTMPFSPLSAHPHA